MRSARLSPSRVDGAVDALAGADVGQVERADNVGTDRLGAIALAPVHVWPSSLDRTGKKIKQQN